MDTYTDIGICGTAHTVIGAPHWITDYYAEPKQIKSELLFFVPLRHPTIMIRKSVIDEHQLYYDKTIPGTEDYDFFIRAARVTKLTNLLDKDLFAYRRTGENMSAVNEERDAAIKASIMRNLLIDELKLHIGDKLLHNLVITGYKEHTKSGIKKLDSGLRKIVRRNERLGVYEPDALCNTMIHRWHREKYRMDLKFNKNIPENLLDCWRQGTYYRPWME